MIVHTIVERQSGKVFSQEYGQNVGAMGLESLDHYLHDASVTPLSEFMHEDRATLEQAIEVAQPAEQLALRRRLDELRDRPDWHDPQDGLQSIQTLLTKLPDSDRYAGIADDLKTYAAILAEAVRDEDLFRFNVETMI
jgi:hypothetical protein